MNGTAAAVQATVRGALVALLVVVPARLAASADAVGEPSGELRIAVSRLPDVLDPVTATAPAARLVSRQLFQGLVEIGERGDLEPGLAAQWRVSRDGLTWTFRLRPDVQFHNGTPLTPDVVVASLARLASGDESEADGASAPPWAALFRGRSPLVREVRRGEGGSVQVQLAQPFSPLLALLAHPALAIVVTERDTPGSFFGTGPYRLAERSPGRLVLEAVAGAGERARTARLVFEEAPDDAAALAELGPGGRLDVAFPRAAPGWGGLGLQVLSGPTRQLGLLALRTHQGATARKPVRQAIALALDPALLAPALGRAARPAAGWLPPGAWAAAAPPALPPHDPGRARRLLAQSGSAGARLTLLAPEAGGDLEVGQLAEAIRLSLAAAGLAVAVRTEPPPAYEAALRGGEGELALTAPTLPADDPHFLLGPLAASDGAVVGRATNVAFYRNPVVDSLLLRASQLGFRPERLRLYHRLQVQLADDLPYIPLYVRLQWAVARPGVHGLRLDPAGRHRLDSVWIEPPAAPPVPAPATAGSEAAPSR